ncbi:hypothetical protein BGX26_005166 [Mortierella sp. AD094]|nr:hypothetical protein BGX26_005166 [Mortierella sp. AD094]
MASQHPSIYSGKWMTLPTMSVPTRSDTKSESSADEQGRVSEDAQTKMMKIDNEARRKLIRAMRSEISSRSNPTTTANNPTISAQDTNLFLTLYRKCFPSDDEEEHDSDSRSVSLLKQEMMIQMLEDFGKLLMEDQPLDPSVR